MAFLGGGSTKHITVDVNVNMQSAESAQVVDKLDAILEILNSVITKEDQIIMEEQQVKDALVQIDTATTKIAGNVQSIAALDQKVSDEVDALVAGMKTAGVSQALIDQAVAAAAHAQVASDASDALVPVLEAIAAKGVTNPVPVPVPPAPPTP